MEMKQPNVPKLETPKAPSVPKTPEVKQPSVDPDEEMWTKQFKSMGFNDDEIKNKYLPEARKSKREALERERIKNEMQEWNRKNELKPKRATPEQMNKIRDAAIKRFGITNRLGDAFYMMPDGRMLSGAGGNYGNRVVDHRDIGSSYLDAGVDIQEAERGGNSHNMMDFMRGGNIRMIPENNSIDIMAKPTDAQMNMIYNMWRRGKLDGIQISNAEDKYGQQLGYLEDIRNERQISDFIRKYFANK